MRLFHRGFLRLLCTVFRFPRFDFRTPRRTWLARAHSTSSTLRAIAPVSRRPLPPLGRRGLGNTETRPSFLPPPAIPRSSYKATHAHTCALPHLDLLTSSPSPPPRVPTHKGSMANHLGIVLIVTLVVGVSSVQQISKGPLGTTELKVLAHIDKILEKEVGLLRRGENTGKKVRSPFPIPPANLLSWRPLTHPVAALLYSPGNLILFYSSSRCLLPPL